jgi:hypothetical protein
VDRSNTRAIGSLVLSLAMRAKCPTTDRKARSCSGDSPCQPPLDNVERSEFLWPLKTKNPSPLLDSGMHPVYFFPSFWLSLAALLSQAGLLTPGSPYLSDLPTWLPQAVVATDFRPRSQRRDRAGLQPASLLSRHGTYCANVCHRACLLSRGFSAEQPRAAFGAILIQQTKAADRRSSIWLMLHELSRSTGTLGPAERQGCKNKPALRRERNRSLFREVGYLASSLIDSKRVRNRFLLCKTPAGNCMITRTPATENP